MTTTTIGSRRWDPLVKFTHWGIAAAVACNALFVGEGSIAHIYAGYAIAAMLAVRLLWGIVGSKPARFASFPPSPSRAFAHIRAIAKGERENHVSHNPLGSLMAYALWACLGVIVATGIAMAGAPPRIDASTSAAQIVSGEAGESHEYYEHERGEEENEEEEAFEEVHEAAVNLLYLLVLMHIGGVMFETVRSGRHTMTAMIPGAK